MVVGLSLGLGLLIRDRFQKTHAALIMTPQTAELPFEDYGGHLYVQGKINGIATKDLIVDSGAVDLFVGEPTVKALTPTPQLPKSLPHC